MPQTTKSLLQKSNYYFLMYLSVMNSLYIKNTGFNDYLINWLIKV